MGTNVLFAEREKKLKDKVKKNSFVTLYGKLEEKIEFFSPLFDCGKNKKIYIYIYVKRLIIITIPCFIGNK
jgi:hypothetical protein